MENIAPYLFPSSTNTIHTSQDVPQSFTLGSTAAADSTAGFVTLAAIQATGSTVTYEAEVPSRSAPSIVTNDADFRSAITSVPPLGSSGANTLGHIENGASLGFQIPPDLPTDMLSVARAYTRLGLTIFPLVPPKPGDETQNGKKPAIKGYKNLKHDWADDKTMTKHWGGNTPCNIACLIPPGMLVVDLDSKADQGRTARDFIGQNPNLSTAMRVSTQGGVHIWIQCPDIPSLKKANGKHLASPLSRVINDSLNAELMLPGMQITLPPSRRETGHIYEWINPGTPLQLTWAALVEIFGFTYEEAKPPTFHQLLNELQGDHKGDLGSLDAVKLFQSVGRYGRLLKDNPSTHAVMCPFSEKHSNQENPTESTSTVIFEEQDRLVPGFCCLHAHCADHTILDVIRWADEQHPSLVDECCLNQWRPQIALPGKNRLVSAFASETGQVWGKTNELFLFGDQVSVLETAPNLNRSIFKGLAKDQAVTFLETHVSFGRWEESKKDGVVFVKLSMSQDMAGTLLAANQFKNKLPRVRRQLTCPVPLLDAKGELTVLHHGYNPLHEIYLQPNAPIIEEMDVDEAKRFILEEFLCDGSNGGFPWRDEQTRTNAIARLLTPMCRGLMGWQKPPLFILLANQPRLGKDTFAMAVQVVFTDEASVGATLGGKEGDTEMRKRITSLLRTGRLFIHFANMKGEINFPSLEAATDASEYWTDRILGHSREATLPNEAEYSISMNVGGMLTPDLMERSVVIELYHASDDPNRRAFKHPHLIDWVRRHRGKILGALMALIREWDRLGRPLGSKLFASFPKWAEIVGGIMEANNLGNPCIQQVHLKEMVGDQLTSDMRRLFAMGNAAFGGSFVMKPALYNLISESGEDAPFAHFDLTGDKASRSHQTKFGKILESFKDRELSGITLRIDESDKNRKKLAFVRKGSGGKLPAGFAPCLISSQTLQTSQTSPSCAQVLPSVGNYLGEDECEPHSPQLSKRDEAAMAQEAGHTCKTAPPATHYKAIKCEEDAQELLALLGGNKNSVGIDLETYGKSKEDALSPRNGQVRLIQIAVGGEIFILDALQAPQMVGKVLDALKEYRLIGHNLAFDLAFLMRLYDFEAKSVFCTMTASRLLHAGEEIPHDLGAVVERTLGLTLAKQHGASNWSGELNQAQLVYAAADVAHLADLCATLERSLEKAGLSPAADLEMGCVLLAVKMQHNGMYVDRSLLQEIRHTAQASEDSSVARIREMHGRELNVNSPSQIIEALRRRGLSVNNSKEETLSTLNDRLAEQLVAAKQARTQMRKCDELIAAIEQDGRIHASFNPMQAKTGRFSTSKPNLQSIPRGSMRSCFRARQGFKLVVADYSQIELRIAASIAGEPKMLDAFKKGADLHTQTAALILNKSEADVSANERQTAKAVNFGLLYGQKPEGLVKYAAESYGVKMTESDASDLSDAFFAAYPNLANWQKQQKGHASAAREVRTSIGRRRTLPQDNKNWWERYSALLNSPIQGGAADGIKMALCRLMSEVPKSCLIVNTVHDEILVECPEEDANTICRLVEQVMVEEMQRLYPDVVIKADAKVISQWAEK